MLILVEGGDGSGKSTLVETLRKFNFKIAKPAALQNKHQFEYYERLALQSIYAEQNVILDRSFLSELVYRIYDKKKPLDQYKFKSMRDYLKVCNNAYNKYKDINNVDDFYNIVAQDYHYIKDLNKVMKNYNLLIYYYPKQKINNTWSYGKIYLPLT